MYGPKEDKRRGGCNGRMENLYNIIFIWKLQVTFRVTRKELNALEVILELELFYIEPERSHIGTGFELTTLI